MTTSPFDAYEKLQEVFSQDVKSEKNQAIIADVYRASCRFLSRAGVQNLKSLVPGKEYFAFSSAKKLSRAVNQRLFLAEPKEWEAFCRAIASRQKPAMETERITRIIYSVAVSFFCCIDLTKDGDQKTPGTFFEYLIGHLFAWRLDVNPKTRLPVLNLDMEATLPTDFVFDLGPNRAKFHLPSRFRLVKGLYRCGLTSGCWTAFTVRDDSWEPQ
jgi:hypothetical protein